MRPQGARRHHTVAGGGMRAGDKGVSDVLLCVIGAAATRRGQGHPWWLRMKLHNMSVLCNRKPSPRFVQRDPVAENCHQTGRMTTRPLTH